MGRFFDLIGEAIDGAKQPKEAVAALYHGILLRGQRALKDPAGLGQQLNAYYDLNLSMYFSFVLYIALITSYLTGFGELVNGRSNIFVFLISPIIGVFFQLLVLWYVTPFLDRIGYRIFGLKVTLERAREVAFAAALPYASPLILGILVVMLVLISLIPALAILSLPLGLVFIFALVQSFRMRKHTLGAGYLVAVCGPLLVWFALFLILMTPIFFLIGIMLASGHGH